MSAWDTVLEVAESPVGIVLGVAGGAESLFKVSKWTFSAAAAAGSALYRNMSNSEENNVRENRCSCCGKTGHNRRTCELNVVCGRCGSKDSEEIWELDGEYCCDLCKDDVDI
jgi:hypothetical protein